MFPYIGYFQLIEKCATFVFYDDVAFIKKGWINKNKIRNGITASNFVAPLQSPSQNKKINETYLAGDEKWILKLQKSLEMNYSKSKNYKEIKELVLDIASSQSGKNRTIADLAIASIESTLHYLNLNINCKRSSELERTFKEEERSNRLVKITKSQGYNSYINSIGGKDLYSKTEFKKKGIDLLFLKPEIKEYSQGKKEFLPGLSIIDLLMNCTKEEVLMHMSAGKII